MSECVVDEEGPNQINKKSNPNPEIRRNMTYVVRWSWRVDSDELG